VVFGIANPRKTEGWRSARDGVPVSKVDTFSKHLRNRRKIRIFSDPLVCPCPNCGPTKPKVYSLKQGSSHTIRGFHSAFEGMPTSASP
jgi:hypothetical protein